MTKSQQIIAQIEQRYACTNPDGHALEEIPGLASAAIPGKKYCVHCHHSAEFLRIGEVSIELMKARDLIIDIIGEAMGGMAALAMATDHATATAAVERFKQIVTRIQTEDLPRLQKVLLPPSERSRIIKPSTTIITA